ncbi:MAG: hypothetical protein U0V70_04675 [Terriglobia bacterium]
MSQGKLRDKEGFHLLRENYVPPSNSMFLDPMTKRKVTICNLFMNYSQSIPDIARILDEDYPSVVTTLIERGLIEERRETSRAENPTEEKQSLLNSYLNGNKKDNQKDARVLMDKTKLALELRVKQGREGSEERRIKIQD